YYRLEMHEEALKAFTGLGDRIRKSPSFHLQLARVHERRGEMRKAVESYMACVHEAGVKVSEYECSICRSRYDGWQARCDVCGTWNSVALAFDEDTLSAEELLLKERPVWAVYSQGEEPPTD
ncbi:MAG: hypothetical protein V3T81_03635, partial [Thermoanaerobaculia bacterium]